MADRLKPEILSLLVKKTGNTAGSIRVQLSLLKRKYKGLTLNAAAQTFAEQHGTSILPKLDAIDKSALASVQLSMIPKREVRVPGGKANKPFKVFFEYATTDKFEKEHIDEINRAYNAGCYTATYILCRKVIENLIIGLLKKKFPKTPDLYFDTGRGRFRDFSEVLKNLSTNKKAFDPTILKAVERLVSKASVFKDGANDKTHSLFHIATKRELEDADVGSILALIASIAATV
jgi:hypothetical protein